MNSRELEDYFHRDRIRLPIDYNDSTEVEEQTIIRLSEWVEDENARMLWLEGESSESEDFENHMSMIAASFVKLVAMTHVPVVSHFCELRRGENLRTGNTAEVQAMIALAYSLLRQLVEFLPPHFNTVVNLSEDFFRRLDGTLASWEGALAVVQDLLDEMPRTLFCIIDGIQWLDDRSTNEALGELVNALRSGKLKVLFTTSGRSACLLGQLSRLEMLEVEKLSQGRREFRLDSSVLQNTTV